MPALHNDPDIREGLFGLEEKLTIQQVRDGAELLLSLLPVFVDTMMSNPNEDWGAPY